MNRVTVRLVGGLGNYMFEIAAAYAYGRKYGKEVVISTQNLFTPQQHFDRYHTTIFEKIKPKHIPDLDNFKVYRDPAFHYTEIPFIEGDVLLDGHFQSEKYFEESKDFIKDLFTCHRKKDIFDMWQEVGELQGKTPCSIHIRRGDYLHHSGCFSIIPLDWYKKAIELMPSDSIFIIFSDDKEWIRENFKEEDGKYLLADPSVDYDDMIMMSLCSNNIIGNSTFSWWGAWLNDSPTKQIITPEKWFVGMCSNQSTKDLIPSSWKIIP